MSNIKPTEFEVMPPMRPVAVVTLRKESLTVRLVLAWLYRVAVVAGAFALIWRGASLWAMPMAWAFLLCGPRSR